MRYSKRGLFCSLILLILLITVTPGSSAQQSAIGPLGDYGDAPDERSAGYSHVNPQMIGSFPSTFSTSSDPSYILHRFPQERVYLGQTVTIENNALLVDRDLDDGWAPGSFLSCSRAHLSVHVTIPREATTGPIYLNVLFDWNHDGRWADFSTCTLQRGEQAADEWTIRNLPLHQQPYSLTPGFSGSIDLPEISTGPVAGELWMRVTISTEPVDENQFAPVAFGGHGWSGQGDFLYGETEDYFSCLLADPKQPMADCPSPLGDQPPIDPPPDTTRNNPPVATDDEALACQATDVLIHVLDNDSDPDNEPLTVVDVLQPPDGTVVINSNNTLTFIADTGYFGKTNFTYVVCDPSGLCDSATVTLTISAPPIADNDTGTTDENTPLTLSILANDSDPDATLTIALVHIESGPSHGTVALNSDDTATYTPNLNFFGSDSFIYAVHDNYNCPQDTATVLITVNPVNDPPVAEDDMGTTDEGKSVTVDVLANDSDADGDTLTVTSTSQPAHATATINPDGTVTYTPAPDFSGTDTFSYTISDGHGGTDTATVTITVNPVNDPPQLTDISDETINEGQTLTVSVICVDLDSLNVTLTASNLPPGATFTDHGNGTGTLSYSPSFNAVQHPAISQTFSGVQITCSDGTLSDTEIFNITVNDVNQAPALTILGDQAVAERSSTTQIDFAQCTDPDGDPVTLMATGLPGFASFSDSNDGTGNLSLTPDFEDSGTYSSNQISCSDGSLTDIKSFTITVTETNRTPEAFPQSITTSEDTPVGITLTGSDPDGDLITFSLVNSPSNGTLSGFNPNTGTVAYTPNGNYNGPDSFTFEVNDGSLDSNIATVTITVTPVNDPPTLTPIPSQSVNEGQTLTLLVSCTDIDGPSRVLTASNLPPGATFTDNGDGTGALTYTPGFDTVQHPNEQIVFSNISITCDDGSATDTDTFNLTVHDVNRVPNAVNDSAITNEDTPVTIDVLANDSDIDGDTLMITGNTQGTDGAVSCTSTQCTYTLDTNFNGTDTFSYTISDGHGGTDTAIVTVTVTPVNDPPDAINDSVSTNEDTVVIVDVLANDTDAEGDTLTVTSSTPASNGTVGCTTAGACTYTPNANFSGTDTFTYTISDGHGGTDTATVTITVNPVNDAPVAEANGPYSCSVGGNVTLSSAGSFDIDGTIVLYQWDLDNNGSFETSGPSPTLSCTTAGTFLVTLQVTDNNGATATDTALVTVNDNDDDDDGIEDDDDDCPGDSEDHDGHEDDDGCPENEAPQADNLELTTPQDTPISGPLPVRDEDSGATLICTLTEPAAHGTAIVNSNCTFMYTPNAGFTGEDEFRYQVSDGQATDSGKVEITVSPTGWDKSSLVFTEEGKNCTAGGTVWATVENKGESMAGSVTWELWYSSSGNPKSGGTLVLSGIIPALGEGAEFTMQAPVNQKGNYMFKAYQRPGHPGQGELWSESISLDPKDCQ